MTEEKSQRRGRLADFWRACRFLGPHRRLVIVSVLCAFVVGAAFTSSLGTMLPVFNILLSGESAGSWIDRKVAEKRTPEKLADNNGFETLGDPAVNRATLRTTDGRSVETDLAPVPWYMRAARSLLRLLPEDKVAAVAWVLVAIAAITLFGNVVRFFQEYLSDKAAILTVNDIRRKLYDHVLHVPLSFFSLKGTSDVTSRLTQEAQTLQDGFKTILGQSIQEPIKAGMAFGLAILVSWKLTLFICLFGPIGVVILRKFGKKMRRASRQALQNSAKMLGQVESTLAGIRVVKASRAERFERRRYREIMRQLIHEQLHMSRIDALNTPVLETMNLLVVCAVVLYAAYLVLKLHTLQPGTFMLVMACLIGIGESLRRVGKVNNVLQKSNSAAARLFEILDIPAERDRLEVGSRQTSASSVEPYAVGREGQSKIQNPKSKIEPNPQFAIRNPQSRPTPLLPLSREITFDNLTFTYPSASAPAVDGVSLTVPRGQCVAIVGRNGSGKTTLLALLPRFYDPQKGRILIDGADIRTATLGSLRKQIGIVTQDSVIFPMSIADNIAYGMPLARREQIEEAARRAFAHDFILEKPQGYDTIVGEHGATLSGGQKQRICIARAILRDTPILILDEATSQVDAESEHLIQQAIEGLMRQRTTFVIAHRFSTILAADTIVVMDKGQVIAQGPHDRLLATCELYQQLYDRQMIPAISAPPSV